jgi:hypothetical protein
VPVLDAELRALLTLIFDKTMMKESLKRMEVCLSVSFALRVGDCRRRTISVNVRYVL